MAPGNARVTKGLPPPVRRRTRSRAGRPLVCYEKGPPWSCKIERKHHAMAGADDEFEQGYELHRAGRLAEAARHLQNVVRRNPRHAPAWHQLGCIASSLAQPETAIEYFTRAVRLDGGQAAYHNNLGECYRMLGRLDEAQRCYTQATRLQADYIAPRANLSLTLLAQGLTTQAKQAAHEALQIVPAHAEEHCAAGALRLLHGDFTVGLAEHEWRLQAPGRAPRTLPGAKWEGEPLAGRSILLYAEQGLGDTLQFIRYVPLVIAAGGRPTLAVARRLIPLVSESRWCEVVALEEPLPECELHSALMSLPWVFHTTLTTVPHEVPYLLPRQDRVLAWKQKLADIEGLRVGIGWQGNPRYPFDRSRSVPLDRFALLAAIPHVRLISLQKEAGVDQLARNVDAFEIVALGSEVDAEGAFLDTAAVICNLDVVVTSDTALAHLAGALGAAVWMPLPIVPDWRWLLERDDSPWYPTMRLFRQARAGDWHEVFERIAAALSTLAAARAAS
jgi:Tfp pilus assembly protein PilF